MRDIHFERSGEHLHFVGNTIFVAIGDGVDFVFAGRNERHDALRANGDITRVGNDRVEIDLEAVWQLDLFQRFFDRGSVRRRLAQ